jgi:lipoyl synthase
LQINLEKKVCRFSSSKNIKKKSIQQMLRRFTSAKVAVAPTISSSCFVLPRFSSLSATTSSEPGSPASKLSPEKEEFLNKFRERLANSENEKSAEEFMEEAAASVSLPCAIPLREEGPTSATFSSSNINSSIPKVPLVKRGEEPLPKWLRLAKPQGIGQSRYNLLKKSMREKKLATVCEEARCPNIGECWGGTGKDENEIHMPTATIMIMGDTCTRACRFCSVKTAKIPAPLDPLEPQKTAKAVKEMGVGYIVITMVDRDDLPDAGSDHVARTIHEVKTNTPVLLECLVGDFNGRYECVSKVANAGLDVYAHNIECVERITNRVRDRRAGYRQSLTTLEYAKKATFGIPTINEGKGILTKTSIMLGFDETEEEIRQALKDCRTAGIDAVTLGQYLQPSRTRMKVGRYVHPSEFDMWKKEADDLGFLYCASGPMVRSSYRAGEYYMGSVLKRQKEKQQQQQQSAQQL